MGLNLLTRIFFFYVTLALGEVIQLSRNNPPSVAIADFEFVIMNYIDNSRDSKESIKIFEIAETIF